MALEGREKDGPGGHADRRDADGYSLILRGNGEGLVDGPALFGDEDPADSEDE